MTSISETAHEQLRTERKLRLIASSEEGFPIDRVPNGTYGFSYSPNTEGLPLYALRGFQSFEIHKLASGELHILGYVAKDDPSLLYPEPYEKATEFVSLPIQRLVPAKMPSRFNGNFVPLTA